MEKNNIKDERKLLSKLEHDLLYKITFIQNKLNSDYYLKYHEKN